MEKQNKEVKAAAQDQIVIPRAVVRAIDQVKLAVEQHGRTAQRLVETTINLYMTCRKEKVDLPQVEVARRTGASKGYISLIWRAAEAAQAKRKDPMKEALRLGFRPFVREYLEIAPSAPKTPTLNVDIKPTSVPPGYARVMSDMHELKREIQSALPRITPGERQSLMLELIELLNTARTTLEIPAVPAIAVPH